MTQTGYEEKLPSEDENKLPSPSSVSWTVELEVVGLALDEKSVSATIRIEDKIVGFVRLPSNEYLIYLRRLLADNL